MKLFVEYRRSDGSPIAVDPAIPCAAEVLDESRLLAELARAFPERNCTGPTNVLDVTYLPRRLLSASFAVYDGADTSIVTVHATPEPPHRNGSSGPSRVLDGWSATANLFPYDTNLHALPRLADCEAMSGVLRWLGETDRVVTRIELVRYVPGQRCVLLLHGAPTPVICRHSALGLAHEPAGYLAALWAHPDRTFTMARPLGFETRLNARFEAALPGDRLDLLPRVGAPLMDAIAIDLANLHHVATATAPANAKSIGQGAVLGRLERTSVRKLRLAFPHLSEELQRYLDVIRDGAAEFAPSGKRVLHGNLHPGNVILDDTAGFVGMDEPVVGDPAFDLAVLAAGLIGAAVEQERPLASIATAIERLPRAYSAVADTPVSDDAYAWYLGAALVGWRADPCLEMLMPGADRVTQTLLDVAHAVLTGGATAPVIRELDA